MAELTVDGLGELTSPAANDEIGIWDVSAGQYLKIRRDTLVGGTITGGGTIALGGYTLTVPATGTVVLVGTAQTITAAHSFSAPQTFTAGIYVGNNGNQLRRYDTGIGNWSMVEVFSLADSATYQFSAKPSGMILIVDVSSGHVGVFTARGGGNATAEAFESGTNFSATKDTANSINFYYDTSAYYIQNKRGSSRNLSVLVLGTIS